MTIRRELHEENRRSWNEATKAHNSHKGDQARFLREGGSTLFPEELELLGQLDGRSLVHLQCNAGQDTLSLAKHGAHVTGVDISDEAIAFAERLSAGSGIPGRFVRSDLYDWFESTSERFDLAFSSYGATGWLSDLGRWAEGIARVLVPGGRFVYVEFHPAAFIFGPDGKTREVAYFYHEGPFTTDGVHDYVALSGEGLVHWGYEEGVRDFVNPHRCHEFWWGIGDVVSALASAGLVLETLREWPYSNGFKPYADMVALPGRRWALPGPSHPLMYGLRVRKPV